MILWGKERTNERTYTTTKHVTTLLLRSRVKNKEKVNSVNSCRICTSIHNKVMQHSPVMVMVTLPFNMFHVFALAYLTTGFLWSTLQFFHCFASASVYTILLRMRGASMFTFKFLQIIYRYLKWSGHETWSSSWSCDRNFSKLLFSPTLPLWPLCGMTKNSYMVVSWDHNYEERLIFSHQFPSQY